MSSERKHFKVGSRKSNLAMVQTESMIADLKKLFPEYTFEINNFDTIGDKILDRALAKIGDKGLFTKELEDALTNRSIDFVVHSLKDMPCQYLPDNLVIGAIPIRENPSDALVLSKHISDKIKTIDDLPENSVIGTSSLRRIAQLKAKYPKLKFENIRGNLNTRFKKLDDDKLYDAIILAVAGLKRLNFSHRISQILPPSTCMHAVSQGALGIECRLDDDLVINMLNRLNDEDTVLRCVAERSFLSSLNGGCSAPIGVNSMVSQNSILLEGIVLSLDGSQKRAARFEINYDTPIEMSEYCPVSKLTTNDETKVDKEQENKESSNKNLPQSYTYVVAKNVDSKKLMKAEFCGIHLANMLILEGADSIIEESKLQVKQSD